MISLPIEVQLCILKYLNFNQLISVKQTNFYFCNLINKYERELARKKFREISIININPLYCSVKTIELQFIVFEFTLNDQLKERWQEAIENSIPLFINYVESGVKYVCIKDYKKTYFLNLPNVPKNLEEMIIVRCWVQKLFNCSFKHASFDTSVFNPEMINILFDNDKTIPLQFNIQDAHTWANNATFETVLKFSLNLISHDLPTIYKHSDSLTINLEKVRISDQQKNILLNILIDEGNKLPKIRFNGPKITKLYDPIINYITTSRDCSIVPEILLDFTTSLHFKLSEKAENVEVKKLRGLKYKNYQISNIYNPKVRFSFSNSEDGELTYCVRIRKMEE